VSNPSTSIAAELFRQAAAQGRGKLDAAEVTSLLGSLGLAIDAQAAAGAVDIRISLNNTREFGMVLSAGLGGLEAELDEGNYRRDRASVYAAAALTDADDFLDLFRRTLAYQKLVAVARRAGAATPDAALKACFAQLLVLAKAFAPGNPDAPFVLQSLELNPVQVGTGITVRAAECAFGAPQPGRLPRPVEKIDKLIHPKRIGIIGVSGTSMNFGRIILRNLMGSGYPKAQLLVLKPGETEIDGVKCVEGLKAIDGKLDLLIVAVAASAVYELSTRSSSRMRWRR